MPKFLTLDDLGEVRGKTLLIRPDFNVPIHPETKEILDDTRIKAHAITIKELSDKGARIVIIVHQGRPGQPDFIESLKGHAKKLSEILGKPVKYVNDLYGNEAKSAIKELNNGEILLLKNVRTFPEERKKKSPEEHAQSEFVKELAPLFDAFILDGFSVAHRSHASVVGFAAVLPTYAGRVMERELKALTRVLEDPQKPVVVVLGGAKAEKTIKIIDFFLGNNIADNVLTGGLVGLLFLLSRGIDLGNPTVENLKKKGLYDLVVPAKELLEKYKERIKYPTDFAIEENGGRKEIQMNYLPVDKPIYDIGEKTSSEYESIIKNAKTIIACGPLGVYEKDEFIKGTQKVFEAIAKSEAYSLAGGGDTVAALKKLGLLNAFSYVSLAGGAFIEFISGGKLPGIEILEMWYHKLK